MFQPNTKPAGPLRNHDRLSDTRRPLQTKDGNLLVNPFSKYTLPDKLTKTAAKIEVKLPVHEKTSLSKPPLSNVLSPKPAGIKKAIRPSTTIKARFASPMMPKAASHKSKDNDKVSTKVKPSIKKQAPNNAKPHPKPKKARPSQKPEHPLAFAFKEATFAYQTHVESNGPKALVQAVSALSARLRAVDVASSNQLAAHADASMPLTKPFKDEKLLLTTRRGEGDEQKVHVTIGERVGTFERFLVAKQATLKDLWSQWETVTADIERLGVGLEPGSEQLEPDGYAAQAKKLEDDYRAEREQILQTFEEESAKLQKSAAASEKKYEAALAKQRQVIMRYMQLEAEIRNSSGDEDDEDDEDEEDDGDDEDDEDAEGSIDGEVEIDDDTGE